MDHLVFFDDDPDELRAFGEIVRGHYEYAPLHWPGQSVNDIADTPHIVVLDLYLPPADVPERIRIPEEKIAGQKILAEGVAACFSRLYLEYSHDAKRLLRETMACLGRGRKLLDAQWIALNQDPTNGIRLMKAVQNRLPGIPVLFYSRKITPENVRHVLRAGAVDALQKGELGGNEVLRRLQNAQQLCKSDTAKTLRAHGFNVNITVLPE